MGDEGGNRVDFPTTFNFFFIIGRMPLQHTLLLCTTSTTVLFREHKKLRMFCV